jgi:hypothetical protein
VVTVPDPLAADAVVVKDPAEWSLIVKPAQTSGHAALLWRQGLRALAEDASSDVWAHVGGHRIARGMPEEDVTLRLQFDYGDSVYRGLASNPRLRATVTVDRATSRILDVRFRGRGRS